jgi:hypothetical protein
VIANTNTQFAEREGRLYLLRSVDVLVLVAVLDELLRLRFILASVVSDGFNPSTLANKFKISVNEITPDNLPIIKLGGVLPKGGVAGTLTCNPDVPA